ALSFVTLCLFFFQAEDGIRARNVTGVQTCALPISQVHVKFLEQSPPDVFAHRTMYEQSAIAIHGNQATYSIYQFFALLTSLKDRSEEHTSELQSRFDLVCRLLLEKKKNNYTYISKQVNK